MNSINRTKSLYFSFLDGIFASIMMGFTLNYVIPFALVLGANNVQIGILNALPQLFGSIIHLKAADIVEYTKSRLKVITLFVFLQSVSYLLILSLLFITSQQHILWFIALTTLSSIFSSIVGSVWLSLMSDTVEKDKYGEYFAWRGKVLGIINLFASFLAGFFLGIIENKFYGFIILFFLAGIARIISGYFISKMEDIPVAVTPDEKFSYVEFIRRFKESNFVKYVLFVSLFSFAVSIATPFFNVYMLKELGMSYYEYTVVTLSAAVSGLFLLPFWGRAADKIGNAKVVKVTGLLICFLPILWIFSKNLIYLILINIFGGYVWAGFNLAVVNFIFDAASQKVRTRCVSYFNFTNGMFIFLGTLLSGWLATHIPSLINSSKLLTLFFISGISRLIIVLYFRSKFYEVRNVEHIDSKEFLFTVLGVKPVMDFSKSVLYPLRKVLNHK
ncbi:MAG: MFS transporter [Endomicrobia bacterium]|nr:MFS transporter [Endomicrobiia bacterium]MCX7940965.1 MFS transporter [Endomicrobiia bacterium]MDW8055634.1 MFS transporter [Elusimicrobiota bacterium]